MYQVECLPGQILHIYQVQFCLPHDTVCKQMNQPLMQHPSIPEALYQTTVNNHNSYLRKYIIEFQFLIRTSNNKSTMSVNFTLLSSEASFPVPDHSLDQWKSSAVYKYFLSVKIILGVDILNKIRLCRAFIAFYNDVSMSACSELKQKNTVFN